MKKSLSLLISLVLLAACFCFFASAKQTKVFVEAFSEKTFERWSGPVDKFTSEGFAVGVHDEIREYNSYTRDVYELGNSFAITFSDTIGFNLTKDLGGMMAFGYSDILVKIYDCGARVELIQNEESIAQWSGERQKEWEVARYSLVCQKGTAKVLFGTATIIETPLTVDPEPAKIRVINAEHYRLSTIKAVSAFTLAEDDIYIPAGAVSEPESSEPSSAPSSQIISKPQSKAPSSSAPSSIQDTNQTQNNNKDNIPDYTLIIIISGSAVILITAIAITLLVIKRKKVN